MIHVWAGAHAGSAGPLVAAAFRRSVGMEQVEIGNLSAASPGTGIAVAVSPDETHDLVAWCAIPGRKLIVFGTLPANLARVAGMHEVPAIDPALARSASAAIGRPAESALSVQYTALARQLSGETWRRPFERFDFTDEWNNLGYGAIRADGSIWATSASVRLPQHVELASIVGPQGGAHGSYAGLFQAGGAHVLWFNRPVGPIDSFEWCLVEAFLAHYAGATSACQPVIGEIPFGYDTAVTSRLDCDEDAASARPLLHSYREWGVPFSIAVHAPILAEPANAAFVRETAAGGGSVLSHSMTHAASWGGDFRHALAEAAGSARALEDACGKRPLNAVSPFHQTPDYAITALAECGYAGCIGGTIREYPETVTARGGALAGHPAAFAFHTQQCMLHGDCLLGEDPIAGYRTAFDLSFASGSMFAWLDHPFSSRYAYGWASDGARMAAHLAMVQHIRARAQRPLFLNEDSALAFLRGKAAVDVQDHAEAFRISAAPTETGLSYGISYRGVLHRLSADGLSLAGR
jgi:hypothetical protein